MSSAASASTQLYQNSYFTGALHKFIAAGYGILYEQDGINGVHAWHTAASGAAGATATYVERMRLTQAGFLGIGMSPSNILDITQTNTSAALGVIKNPSTGVAASAAWAASNSAHSLLARMHSTLFTTSNEFRADGALLYTDGSGGMSYSIPSDAFRWYIGGSPILALTSASLGIAVGGISANYDGNSITTNYSGGYSIIATANGVNLPQNGNAWAAISDYRAKNVSGAFTDSGAIIDAVPVHLAALKTQPENVKAMFLAHEVQAAVPYAVHGEKDGEKMQVLESTDPLVPILWAELQSVRQRLAILEQRV